MVNLHLISDSRKISPMPSRWFYSSFVSALALLSSSTTVLHAAVPNRISTISDNGRTALAQSVPGRARRSVDLGQASLDRTLPSVTLNFNLSAAQQAALNQLIIDQQDPGSPRYHQWLTPEQYGAQFGLSASDLAKVSTWLTSQGLKITAVAPSSDSITVTGTVAQVQSALGASLHTLSLDGQVYLSNVTEPALPAALANVVNGITGLSDFHLKPRSQFRTVVKPSFTSSISGNHFVAPGDFYTIYDEASLLSSSVNGSGITVAIAGQTDISLSDVAAFRSASGLTANAPRIVLTPSSADPGTISGDVNEAQLDVEWSGAVAPGATILYVNSSSAAGGVITSLIYAIDNNVAPIVSISYGACENDWGQSNLNVLNAKFQKANLQGQTIVGPAGDSGATDCDYLSTTAAGGLAVDFPASSPYVTGAGGTTFNEGAGTFWNTSNGTNSGSATGYIPESVWNESNANGLGAGGGGVSAYFSKPAWQVGSGVPNDLARDVPDIALNAASAHDGVLYCVQGSCVNGFRNSDQTLSVVGGTSVAAPEFAGLLALVAQKTAGRLGNANPQIYGLANSTFYNNVFHDITSGNNNSPCVQGSPNCPNGGSIGYSAATGYDLSTGWGSIDAFNLVNKWGTVAATGAGSTTGSNLTNTVLSTTAPTCGISSGSLALSISVSGSASGSPVPTGTVQILVDNAAVGAPVALANGSGTYTLSTSALSSGGHTISAVYLGSSSFAGSKGSLLTDVVSSTQPDFSITPCTSTATAASGGSAPGITFTVNPFNGFTGPVTFSALADVTLGGSYSFSVTPVVISGTGSGTTVLTLNAFQNNSTNTTNGLLKLGSNSHPNNMPGRRFLYGTGSGIAVASLLLLSMPRRRRWGALLVAVLSVGVIGVNGCGSGQSTINSGPVTPTPSTTPATRGVYTVTVVGTSSGSSGSRVHSTQVTFTIQ